MFNDAFCTIKFLDTLTGKHYVKYGLYVNVVVVFRINFALCVLSGNQKKNISVNVIFTFFIWNSFFDCLQQNNLRQSLNSRKEKYWALN